MGHGTRKDGRERLVTNFSFIKWQGKNRALICKRFYQIPEIRWTDMAKAFIDWCAWYRRSGRSGGLQLQPCRFPQWDTFCASLAKIVQNPTQRSQRHRHTRSVCWSFAIFVKILVSPQMRFLIQNLPYTYKGGVEFRAQALATNRRSFELAKHLTRVFRKCSLIRPLHQLLLQVQVNMLQECSSTSLVKIWWTKMWCQSLTRWQLCCFWITTIGLR